MIHEINKNFSRLGLHDSHFSDLKIDKDVISIKIDWGFLENYQEGNISESIVFGHSNLFLFGVRSHFFKKLNDQKNIRIDIPESILTNKWLIMSNSIVDDGFLISMTLLMTNDFKEYLEWNINFMQGKLIWNEFILHKDWLSGQESLS